MLAGSRNREKQRMSKQLRNPITPHEVVRLDIEVHQAYDEFCRRYESAVPLWDRERAVDLVQRKAPWSDVVAEVAASAPYDFLLFWKMDMTPLMSLAGDRWRCTEYLMGNPVIAETMYRHDPLVALLVPLRCAIYEVEQGARFAI